MYKVIHDRCKTVASKDLNTVTQGYDAYCPHCDEDLLPSEILVQVSKQEHHRLTEVIKVNDTKELRILQDYGSKQYVGLLGRTISTVDYDNPLDVALYHWAKESGHN